MRRRRDGLVICLMVLIAAMAFARCGDDDDDDSDAVPISEGDDDFDDDDQSEECLGNSPPVITGLTVLVNGTEQEPPIDAAAGDVIDLRVEYSDANCNLSGGSFEWEDGETDDATGADLPADLGCSNQEAGEPLAIDGLPPCTFADDHCSAFLDIADACGEFAGAVEIEMNEAAGSR